MAKKPRTGPPVAWSDYGEILDYLKQNEEHVKTAFCRGMSHREKEQPAYEFLSDVAKTWKEHGNSKPFEVPLTAFLGKPSAITTLISYANRYLKIATGQDCLARDAIPCLTIGKGVVRFVWTDSPASFVAEDHERRFSRVYYLYREWRNSAQDDLFRGFTAMAEALGIEPVLARFNSKEEIASEVLRIVKHEHEQKDKPGPISIVMALEDEADVKSNRQIAKAREIANGKLFLTRTEFDNAQLQQNNTAIGQLIARCMIRDLTPALKKHPRRNKVLLIDADLGKLSSFKVRKEQFKWTLEDSACGLTLHEHPVKITYDDFYSSGVVEKVREATAAILKQDKAKEIIAIYAGYFSLTWGTIAAARETGRTPADLSIYSEDVIYSLIRELGKPASCLKATCGVDPYHYGRYLLRVAATRSKDDEADRAVPPEPFVLTKDDVTYDDTSKISYMHEICPERLSFHQGNGQHIDVRLENSRYAWKPWMRQCLPHSYGPDLVKKRRSPLGKAE